MSVDYISFSAHCDFNETSYFIQQTKPKNVVIVHGEKFEIKKLHSELQMKFPDIQIFSPSINQTITCSLQRN